MTNGVLQLSPAAMDAAPFARRIKRTVDGTTWYLWDAEHLLAEFDAFGNRMRRCTYAGGYAPAEQAIVSRGSPCPVST